MAVLFAWQLFFAPKPAPVDPNANTNANVAAAAPTTATPAQPAAATSTPPVVTNPDTTPAKTITIKSPLYEVKIDSKGAVASSWIINKNQSPKADFPVYADGSNGSDKKPLQLISQEALNRNPRELPFRIATDDAALNTSINERNYQISAAEETITLNAGEERTIEMTLTDGGVSVKKTFVFRGDSYVSDLAVSLTNNGQPVPNTRLLIGASIGDHAINNHTFYHPESEAVAGIGGDIYRHQGNYSFTYDASNQATLTDKGQVEWAAVADSYFAMAAVPAVPGQNVEYRASKYDVQTMPFYSSIFQWILRNSTTTETRHLVTVYLPITTDGSVTKVYTGTKDYFLLSELSSKSNETFGRNVDITNLINFSSYSFLRWMVKPIAIVVLHSLNFFNSLTGNYGVAIIVFTFLFYML
ncbi:MAG TPA: membrane protein insertase YidC, partial [Pyrinomonadaceae bacterium]|nr:membrane protein insertase YidC [Pyrinomonadaceae bacterium]